MKTNRLMILVAVMALLAVVRFAFPPKATEYATAEPVVRKPVPGAATIAPPLPAEASKGKASDEGDVPGNAFAVRIVPPPAPVAPVPVVNVPVAAMLMPQPAANPQRAVPPLPPLQVIGTYDDGGTPAVFLATPSGTLIARPGSVLMSEYRVTAITAQHVTLTQVSTQQSFQLPLPGSTAR